MGYLDNSTIVVDAVLTKQGRKLLALGQGLNISYFTLTDTGVDYSLWNPDHPSGSAYYGEAIENLPNLEALPNAAYFMRNSLITLPRNQTSLPYVDLGGEGIGVAVTGDFGTANLAQAFNPTLQGMSETMGWQLVIPDTSLIYLVAGEGAWVNIDISGNAKTYLNDQEITNAALMETDELNPKAAFKRYTTTTSRSTVVTFISRSTGAYKHATITMDKGPTVSGG